MMFKAIKVIVSVISFSAGLVIGQIIFKLLKG